MFYDEPQCRGTPVKLKAGSGELFAITDGMDNNVRSFMVLESGLYPTRGIVDAYLSERASLRVNASSVDRSAAVGDRSTVDSSVFESQGDSESAVVVEDLNSTFSQ